MHRVNQPVTDFGDELQTLVADMVATMNAAEGVGLAANQVGVDLQLFVFDCPDASGKHHVGHVVNPGLVSAGGKIDDETKSWVESYKQQIIDGKIKVNDKPSG